MSDFHDRLFREILMARKRVYVVAQPTPLEPLHVPVDAEVWLKREDLSPINSYKWRGAYNRMAVLKDSERAEGVVCASAGNHAQGVALAARTLGCHAKIFMPVSTPRMKLYAVKLHGGDNVEIVLVGDSYADAAAEAHREAHETKRTFVHAYDDFATMGGQGTLADEVVMSGVGPFDVAYLQIGGGGMAAAVGTWLREYYPEIRLVGVEGINQASMLAAMQAGHPVTLDHVDVFADGTAVKRVGDLTYPICARVLDEIVTVTNEEVSAAIEILWEARRCIAEPSGAMGLAGMMKQRDKLAGKRVLTICAGANIDFDKLAWVALHAGIGAERRRYYRFEMSEAPGGLLYLLDHLLSTVNIIDVQYGKVDERTAWPVIGFEAESNMVLDALERKLDDSSIPHEDVTSATDVEFRLIKYNPALFRQPYFMTLDFPERPGALREFLLAMQNSGSICYFSYTYTGGEVGRALIGFEFESTAQRERFIQLLKQGQWRHAELAPEVIARM